MKIVIVLSILLILRAKVRYFWKSLLERYSIDTMIKFYN